MYKQVTEDTTGATLGSALTFGDNVEHSAIVATNYYVVMGNKTGDATGSTFEFKGIDDGTYVLVETTVPAGYNAWTSATVTVSATHDETSDDPQLTVLTATAPFTTSNVEAGTVDRTKSGETHSRVLGEAYAEIINQSGTTLPSTGGIGTTIFYVVGSILVVAAGVLLITKKRMSREG